MTFVLTTIFNFINSKWAPWAALMTALIIVHRNFLGILDTAHTLIASLTPVPAGSSAFSVGTLFDRVNYVLPIDLCIALFIIYVHFAAAMWLVRSVKTWVPLISG